MRDLSAWLARGPLLLDAAMGTRLMARGLDLRAADPSAWNLVHPEAVLAIHRSDVAAGADGVLTNTFGANRHWLARCGRTDDVEAINRAGVLLAREAAGPDRFVIGSVGPTAASDPAAAVQQSAALIKAGVDALLFETCLASQAIALMEAVRSLDGPPRLVSLVEWPDPPDEPAQRLVDLGAVAIGGNCQPGMEPMLALAERLQRSVAVPLLVKPNAGLPGEALADPASFAAAVPALLERGVRLLGGCCGTTVDHVAALREALTRAVA